MLLLMRQEEWTNEQDKQAEIRANLVVTTINTWLRAGCIWAGPLGDFLKYSWQVKTRDGRRPRSKTAEAPGQSPSGSRLRHEKKGGKYIAPRDNNENDGVSKRVHELAFGIVICFGSAEFLHISTTLYIDASLHSPTTPHASASPTAFLVSRRLAGVPARRIRPASVGPPR